MEDNTHICQCEIENNETNFTAKAEDNNKESSQHYLMPLAVFLPLSSLVPWLRVSARSQTKDLMVKYKEWCIFACCLYT